MPRRKSDRRLPASVDLVKLYTHEREGIMNWECWKKLFLLKPSEELHLKKCSSVFKEGMLQKSQKTYMLVANISYHKLFSVTDLKSPDYKTLII